MNRSRLDNALLFFVALTLAATPVVSSSIDLTAHDFSRLVQVGLLTGVALWAAVGVLVAQNPWPVPMTRRFWGLLMLWGALAAASVWQAEVLRGALREVGLLASLGVLVLVTARALVHRDLVRVAAWVVLGGAALLAFAASVRYLAGMSEGVLSRWWLIPGYSNYRFFNHVQSVALPLLAAVVVWSGKDIRLRRWGWVLLALEFCWLLFTGGRATMLALFAAALVVALLYRAHSKAWIRTLMGGAALGVVLYSLLFVALPYVFDVKGDYTALETVERTATDTGQTRRYLWNLALNDIAESPLFGIGPQHYAHRVNHEAAHPHNIYLQVAAEWGVPMLALVLGAAALGLRRLVRAVRQSQEAQEAQASSWGVGLTAAFVAVAVDGALSGNFVMPNSQLWIAFALALAVAYVRQAEGAPVAAAPLPAGWILRGLMALFIVFAQYALWQGAWPEVLDVYAHVEEVKTQVRNSTLNPRFWSHGWF